MARGDYLLTNGFLPAGLADASNGVAQLAHDGIRR